MIVLWVKIGNNVRRETLRDVTALLCRLVDRREWGCISRKCASKATVLFYSGGYDRRVFSCVCRNLYRVPTSDARVSPRNATPAACHIIGKSREGNNRLQNTRSKARKLRTRTSFFSLRNCLSVPKSNHVLQDHEPTVHLQCATLKPYFSPPLAPIKNNKGASA